MNVSMSAGPWCPKDLGRCESCGDPCEVSLLHRSHACKCSWCRQFELTVTDGMDWIQTFTGRAFHPCRPDPAEVVIDDIAHALANQCRFTGHTKRHYSVAQHSVLIALVLPKDLALEGLLHDASEAYLVDLPAPLKVSGMFEAYKHFERRAMWTIRKAFRLRLDEPGDVKLADKRMLSTEFMYVMGPGPGSHRYAHTKIPPYEDLPIVPWEPERAEAMFLAVARLLMEGRQDLPAWGSLLGTGPWREDPERPGWATRA